MVSPQSTITCFTFYTCIQCTVVLWCWNRWNDGATFVQRCRFVADLRRKFEIKTRRRWAAALWTFGFTRGLGCRAVCVKLEIFCTDPVRCFFLNNFFPVSPEKLQLLGSISLYTVGQRKLHPFYFLNNSEITNVLIFCRSFYKGNGKVYHTPPRERRRVHNSLSKALSP